MCLQKAEEVCGKFRDDPYLIGYYLCDCVEWPIIGKSSKKLRLNWLDTIKLRGRESAGKQVYVQLMRERYADISAFNDVYGTAFRSFEDLYEDREFVYAIPR